MQIKTTTILSNEILKDDINNYLLSLGYKYKYTKDFESLDLFYGSEDVYEKDNLEYMIEIDIKKNYSEITLIDVDDYLDYRSFKVLSKLCSLIGKILPLKLLIVTLQDDPSIYLGEGKEDLELTFIYDDIPIKFECSILSSPMSINWLNINSISDKLIIRIDDIFDCI